MNASKQSRSCDEKVREEYNKGPWPDGIIYIRHVPLKRLDWDDPRYIRWLNADRHRSGGGKSVETNERAGTERQTVSAISRR